MSVSVETGGSWRWPPGPSMCSPLAGIPSEGARHISRAGVFPAGSVTSKVPEGETPSLLRLQGLQSVLMTSMASAACLLSPSSWSPQPWATW